MELKSGNSYSSKMYTKLINSSCCFVSREVSTIQVCYDLINSFDFLLVGDVIYFDIVFNYHHCFVWAFRDVLKKVLDGPRLIALLDINVCSKHQQQLAIVWNNKSIVQMIVSFNHKPVSQ